MRSNTYELTTAPAAADPGASVSFAFASDSRQGLAGEEAFMGVNYKVLSRIAEDAHSRGAQLLLFGGDLIGGFTSSNADFRLQLKAWKKAVSGFWRTRPVYPAMGNHEALSNVFDDGSRYGRARDTHVFGHLCAEQLHGLSHPFRRADGGRPRERVDDDGRSDQHGAGLQRCYGSVHEQLSPGGLGA